MRISGSWLDFFPVYYILKYLTETVQCFHLTGDNLLSASVRQLPSWLFYCDEQSTVSLLTLYHLCPAKRLHYSYYIPLQISFYRPAENLNTVNQLSRYRHKGNSNIGEFQYRGIPQSTLAGQKNKCNLSNTH